MTTPRVRPLLRRGGKGARVAFASLLLLSCAAALAAPASRPMPLDAHSSARDVPASSAFTAAARRPLQAADTWTRLGPVIGKIADLAESPSNPAVVYAAVDVESGAFAEGGNGAKVSNGVYKSVDGGLTWAATGLTGKTLHTVAVDPTNAATVYAGGFRSGVFKSTDGGRTWGGPYRPANQLEPDAYFLVVHPQTPTTLYASFSANFSGLFRSTDGGLTWTLATGSTTPLLQVSFDPQAPSVIYAAGGSGSSAGVVFKSTDNGQSWSRVGTGLPSGDLTSAVAVDPSNTSVLYVGMSTTGVAKSTDGGQSWAAAGAGLPPAAGVAELIFDTANPPAVVAATRAGVYKTMDAGQSWSATALAPTAVQSLARLGGNAPTMLAGTRGLGIYRSGDAGATWSLSGAGLPRPAVRLLAVSTTDPARIYAGTDDGLYETGDRGANWSIAPISNPLGRPVRGLALDPLNPSTLYVGLDYTGLFKSADGGATWAQFFMANSPFLALAIDPSTPSTFYWSIYTTNFYKATGGGALFGRISSPGVAAAIAVDPTNSQIVYAGTSFTVAKSTNGGGSWASTPLRAQSPRGEFIRSLAIDPNATSTVYATLYKTDADPHGAYRSTDGGQTWQPVFADAASPPLSIAVTPSDPNVVYAGTAAGVVRSADAGLTSQPFADGIPAGTAVHALAFDAAGQYLYAGTSDGVFRAQISPCGYVPTPKTQSFTAAGGAGAFNIVHLRPDIVVGPGASGCGLSAATSGADWITIRAVSETNAGVTIDYAVAPNEGNARGGVIRIRNQVVHVAQSAAPSAFAFAAAEQTVGEGDPAGAQFIITRHGDNTFPASVTYATVDDPAAVPCDPTATRPDGTPYPRGAAYARCDYATTIDTVSFAAGETSKTVRVPLVDDGHAEGPETFRLALSQPSGDTSLAARSSVAVIIADNDGADAPNPIYRNNFFVRQQYLDFLSREPEAGEPWTAILDRCPDVYGDPGCDRVLVSQSFFQSPEFQLKGFFVYNFYKVAFGRLPLYAEITSDMRGVTGQTPEEVFFKRHIYTQTFVERPEFKAIYDSKNGAQYVEALAARYNLQRITTHDPANPDGGQKVTLTTADLGTGLATGRYSRAQILRAFVQSDEVNAAEFNRAFVAMQYFGYLRRDPEPTGYQAWLDYLGRNPGDYRTMVNGFANSAEYVLRFGRR
ncbi:MAG TPA: DUF4214 domain-containing protein [Pyrinomonadaceae bacterium]|nr:DUF4214 domain-containing protein [Pyrinomonadaceae bacterium]